MNYIVLDLEWNQSPRGKAAENPRIPFEIIEIGAVKLNEHLEMTDSFERLIRPTVYREMNAYTREITHLTMQELSKGMPFREAAEEFLKWIGTDFRLCTWGPLDVTELQRNLDYFGMEKVLPGPVIYEDVQQLYGIAFESPSVKRSLKDAVDKLGIEEDLGFHHALNDAEYTARILASIPEEIISKNYTVDCYQTPQSRAAEIRIRYDSYERYISREFRTREALMEDVEIASVKCFSCRKNVKRRVGWFSDGGKNYYAVGICPEHGYMKCRIKVNQTTAGGFSADKTIGAIGKEDAVKISMKQTELRARRQRRRRK
ncbi:MAG: 3'-5' exonuclease [Lachnospiraceae bacterium]|nr:3'-5' exonuclease [Lachnospiraceae bacterium]